MEVVVVVVEVTDCSGGVFHGLPVPRLVVSPPVVFLFFFFFPCRTFQIVVLMETQHLIDEGSSVSNAPVSCV